MRYQLFFRYVLSLSIAAVIVLISFTESMCLELMSDDFENGGIIPIRYTGLSEDISPGLSWGDIPARTQSFAIIVDDPDAPMGNWVHWIIFNIPKDARALKRNILKNRILPNGTLHGINSFGRIGYNGPYPPPGPAHRYIFTLYALDTVLDVTGSVNKTEFLQAINGHILAKAQLVGWFGR